MYHNTDDLRIRSQLPLLTPALVLQELRPSERATEVVSSARRDASKIISGQDDRLLVIVGPCSVHDVKAAHEYAGLLLKEAKKHAADLLVVMRVYFEKPRTTVGWKGLINDPQVDGSFRINDGLRIARRLLADIADLGLPSATEFLDPITPQYVADLVSYGAIGARTTESQIHRELASGLSMPVGFKNGTDGSIQVAVDACLSARSSHWFPSVTKEGVVAIFQTSGNPDAHIILRGGSRTGPNYGAEFVTDATARIQKAGLTSRLVIDCSHGNSSKEHRRQMIVAADIATQVSQGSTMIAGVMIESHLVEGRQDWKGADTSAYGCSITDACISFAETIPVLDALAQSVRQRRALVKA
ncbi:MAG: 3-deoxy-7-phosphoheptulonate synthase [Verrucomicrobia bacterium]|nr:3-deoxy-7-phosphoheptulonate synthase [Verrucomicrobiota bacterium]NBS04406.1 3-deoxy-7-phosphoheptulonate synthase [Verrucomicrobiota bacterium]NBY36149.1 3-deoxy-7-phosphoheptulonate synthase [Verrucomicrobiota bacterium]